MRDLKQKDGSKTQDGRMTKKCRARLAMHSFARHFFVILPGVLSLSAVLLRKVCIFLRGHAVYLNTENSSKHINLPGSWPIWYQNPLVSPVGGELTDFVWLMLVWTHGLLLGSWVPSLCYKFSFKYRLRPPAPFGATKGNRKWTVILWVSFHN